MIGRRPRAVLSLAAAWGGVWAASGALLLLIGMPGILSHFPERPRFILWVVWRALRHGVPTFALWGAASGALFATLLAVAERRRTLGGLRGVRIAAWGAAAGAVPPLLVAKFSGPLSELRFPHVVGMSAGGAAVLGVAAALATLQVARRRHNGSFGLSTDGEQAAPASQGGEPHRYSERPVSQEPSAVAMHPCQQLSLITG